MHGVIVGTQHPRGKGGILLTDRKYNDQLITEFTDTANHAANGATDGMIAIQMHYSDEKTPRWTASSRGASRCVTWRLASTRRCRACSRSCR